MFFPIKNVVKLKCTKCCNFVIKTNPPVRDFSFSEAMRERIRRPKITQQEMLSFDPKFQKGVRTVRNYLVALVIGITGMGFAAVPLYDTFCRITNYAGTVNRDVPRDKTKNLKRNPNREIMIVFNADTSSYLRWNFKPLQTEIKVVPGETVLAFYSAENRTNTPISGISTYNVVPFLAAQYFNKIQCFCFDEQQLNPHEQVDMPVFFYIDPEFAEDPNMLAVDKITLSYTFFEAREGIKLPFVSTIQDLDDNFNKTSPKLATV